jgi:hypothetical protein
MGSFSFIDLPKSIQHGFSRRKTKIKGLNFIESHRHESPPIVYQIQVINYLSLMMLKLLEHCGLRVKKPSASICMAQSELIYFT